MWDPSDALTLSGFRVSDCRSCLVPEGRCSSRRRYSSEHVQRLARQPLGAKTTSISLIFDDTPQQKDNEREVRCRYSAVSQRQCQCQCQCLALDRSPRLSFPATHVRGTTRTPTPPKPRPRPRPRPPTRFCAPARAKVRTCFSATSRPRIIL